MADVGVCSFHFSILMGMCVCVYRCDCELVSKISDIAFCLLVRKVETNITLMLRN